MSIVVQEENVKLRDTLYIDRSTLSLRKIENRKRLKTIRELVALLKYSISIPARR